MTPSDAPPPPGEDDLRLELELSLPSELPGRERVVTLSARHLALVVSANARLNLTRIASAREMAVKHVLDSLLFAELFADAATILDIGSGAGFPGVPLALAFTDKRVLLAESVGKKATFLAEMVRELALENVEVRAERGEAVLRDVGADAVVARAVAPTARLLRTLAPLSRRFGRLVLYKGPAGEEELRDSREEAKRLGLRGRVAARRELPDGLGTRTALVYTRARR